MVDERQDVCRRELGAPEPKGDVVASEVGYLLHHRVLLERNRYAVLEARADQAPYVLYEVGRLREIACRGWRGGSARGTDLDRFDLYYSHLVLWDKDRRQVALVLADTALWKRSLLRRVAGMEGMNCLALAWRDGLTGFRAA